MSLPPAKLSVLAGERFACLKIAGRANLRSSPDLKDVMGKLLGKGYRYVVVDLSECALMDSSFLGTLVKFGIELNPPGKEAERAIELLNPNERVIELFESLCVLHLFRLNQGGRAPAGCDTPLPHTPVVPEKAELFSACQEAHDTLVSLNPELRPKFVDVLKFLRDQGPASTT
jgi:anti-anti-sigma regulatory factor